MNEQPDTEPSGTTLEDVIASIGRRAGFTPAKRRLATPDSRMAKWAIRLAKYAIPVNPSLNLQMVNESDVGQRFHGCSLDKVSASSIRKRHSDGWRCQFFIRGRQRIIGRGTLYQCARIFDAASLRFAPFRIYQTTPVFNFSREQAESDLKTAPFENLFSALEVAFGLVEPKITDPNSVTTTPQ
jgi:hypothetical protein